MRVFRFSASWCNPCKNLARTLEAEKLNIEALDVDNPEVKAMLPKYGVRTVPAIVLEKDDGTFETIVGSVLSQESKDKIRQALAS